ncbi:hypothetical protein DPMN_099686 [Dreissena polymorpha]|uniref:Uncharacterized protein n=1 Tax=Dreissena polymorpha TaxID=45954 RepID=A0A9D4R7X1_DREPO|nr:hypothetical protein DPMN_099686 [Dreissena polymorpha]
MMVYSVLTEEPICTKYAVQDKLVDVVFELQHQDMTNAAIETRVDGLDTKLTTEDKQIVQTNAARMSVGDVLFVEGKDNVSGSNDEFREHSSITGILINNC